jgi:hypothetical protein
MESWAIGSLRGPPLMRVDDRSSLVRWQLVLTVKTDALVLPARFRMSATAP